MIEFGIESLMQSQADIESLLPAQWAHTGDRELECRPNWPLYHQFAEHDALMVVMARDLDEPVGYAACFIYPHPNAMGTLIAAMPTYYVKEGPVRALVLKRMVDFAAKTLAERGVFELNIETNADFSAGRLWELMGFKLKKLGYSMPLTKPAGERYA